jgi:hypothetical protein
MTQFLASGMTLAPLARWDQRGSRASVLYIPCRCDRRITKHFRTDTRETTSAERCTTQQSRYLHWLVWPIYGAHFFGTTLYSFT